MAKVNDMVKPWSKRLALKKISLIAIAVCLVLLLVLVGFSIYGNNVGNFVVGIEESSRLSLTLSEDGTFTSTTSTGSLNAVGMKNTTNATYSNIPTDIEEGFGNKTDIAGRKYFAYSFCLKNTSDIAVTYNMKISITEVYKNVDAAVRVMVITNGESVIYAKPGADGRPEEHNGISRPYTTTPFVSAKTVCSVNTDIFGKGEVVKYTVVMWLEGYDEECIDDIKGGAIRMSMQFQAR